MDKHCWCCGLNKDTSCYNRDSSRKDGLMNICKDCRRKKRRTGRPTGRPPVNSLRDGFGRKQCSKCRKWRHESEFHKGPKLASDGLDPRCKFCQSGRTHGSRDDEARAGLTRLCSTHFTSEKRGKRRKNLISQSEASPEVLFEIWKRQGGCCALTGIEMTFIKGKGRVPTNCSLDRIDSRKPYTRDNLHLVCYQVNCMKGELGMKQLKFWCNAILGGRATDPDTESKAVAAVTEGHRGPLASASPLLSTKRI